MANRTIYSWTTHKDTDGTFSFRITRSVTQYQPLPNGSYCARSVVKTESGFKTRARAKSRGLQWLRYFRANN